MCIAPAIPHTIANGGAATNGGGRTGFSAGLARDGGCSPSPASPVASKVSTARAGNRRFSRLSAPCAPYKTAAEVDLRRRTPRPLNHPGRARTVPQVLQGRGQPRVADSERARGRGGGRGRAAVGAARGGEGGRHRVLAAAARAGESAGGRKALGTRQADRMGVRRKRPRVRRNALGILPYSSHGDA
jgi:hypothetical protein